MRIKAKLEPGGVAVVTGGSSGIGKAIACVLAERGMHVWLVAQRKELLDSARQEVETHRNRQDQIIDTISIDVSKPEQVQQAISEIMERCGKIDLLVNAAGVTHPGYVQDLDISIFHWMMDVDYYGTVYMTKAVLPGMINQHSGYILNFASFAGWLGGFGYTAYGAAKFAVRGFTEALRQEMKPYGIGVSIIYPSDTDTPQLEYENHYKPVETKALANFTGAMKPNKVAKIALNAIERGQFMIFPALEGKFWRVVDKVSSPLLQFTIDLIVADAVKKKNSASQEKE